MVKGKYINEEARKRFKQIEKQWEKMKKVKKEYYWTVEASGYVDAESYEEAKKMVEEDVDGLVMDDRRYWRIEVGTEPDSILEDEDDSIKHGRAE